tara:strand:- start:315 stop:560 length:246 start_codon:yes stop_codon:yes gene_type:complete
MSAKDHQVGGDHYKKMKIQPIDYIMANQMPFCEASVVKYVSRWRDKNGVEDLRKAKQLIDFIIEDEIEKTKLITLKGSDSI